MIKVYASVERLSLEKYPYSANVCVKGNNYEGMGSPEKSIEHALARIFDWCSQRGYTKNQIVWEDQSLYKGELLQQELQLF